MGISLLLGMLLQAAPVTLVTHDNLWVGDVTLSHDGSRLAYILNENKKSVLWIRNTSNLQGEKVALPSKFGLGIVFAPDGKSMYYSAPDTVQTWVNHLYQWPLNGGESKKIADHIDTPIAFSPDGGSFAFVRNLGQLNFGLVIRGATDAHERQLADGIRRVSPAWSPDGREIACAKAGHLAFVSVRTGAVREIPVSGLITALAWPARGNGVLALIATDQKQQTSRLWRYPLDADKWTPVTSPQELLEQHRISASPDGSTVATVLLKSVIPLQGILDWFGAPKMPGYYSEVALIHAN